jgi:hypothetical protein
MGGKASRDKGQRAEREFAKLIGGHRVPLSGGKKAIEMMCIGLGLEWEVKRRKSGFKQLYEWIEDEREKPDAVALRTDNKQWLVCMTLDKFMELMNDEESN